MFSYMPPCFCMRHTRVSMTYYGSEPPEVARCGLPLATQTARTSNSEAPKRSSDMELNLVADSHSCITGR